MERVASFEKVTLQQFSSDMLESFTIADVELENMYEEIRIPKRATAGSAGYDFHIPFNLELSPNKSVKIPTGIRCKMENSWVLQIFPRSSLGFKYRLQLDNTVGIIDADYYNAVNQGHIIIKVTNHSDQVVSLKQGDRFAQGIFIPYGITYDDEVTEIRTGGFGSTNKKEVIVEKRDDPNDDFIWHIENSNEEVVLVETSLIDDPSNSDDIQVFKFVGLEKGETEVKLVHKKIDEELVDQEQVFKVRVDENKEVTLL